MSGFRDFYYGVLSDYVGPLIWFLIAASLALLLATKGCNSNNLEYVKKHGPDKWRSIGFEIAGYDGYQRRLGYGTYGGAQVWWYLKRVPDTGLLYNGYIERWGDELHVYNLKPLEKGTLLAHKTVPPEPKTEPALEIEPTTELEPLAEPVSEE